MNRTVLSVDLSVSKETFDLTVTRGTFEPKGLSGNS